jgi:hypothetical protein
MGADRRLVLGIGAPRGTTDHVVTLPDRSPHRAVKIGDAMLLLMDTLAALRAGTRVVVFDPLVRPDVCDACSAAYAEARRIIEAAGGLRAWAAKYQTPP